MADSKSSNPFDVKTVAALADLMTKHDLAEIDLRDGSVRLRLLRGIAASPAQDAPPATLVQHAAMPAPAAAPAVDSAPPRASHFIEIKSEAIGTFYSSPKPDQPPFVKVGARVKPDTVVGLVEAMKTYNEIQAHCTGVIVDIVVQNREFVDYNKVLFRVDPSA